MTSCFVILGYLCGTACSTLISTGMILKHESFSHRLSRKLLLSLIE